MTQTLFVNDPFNGTPGDSLGTANPGWQKVPGATGDVFITSTGDRLRFSGSTLYYLSSAPAPSSDYSATIELYIASATNGPGVGVAVRLAGNAQTYYLARLLIGTGIQLYRVLGGTSTLLGSAPYSAVVGAMLRLRLDANGSALNVYVDDAPTPVISAIDTAIPDAGYVGIRAINAATQLLVESLTASSEPAGGAVTDGFAAPNGAASVGQAGAATARGSAAASPEGAGAATSVGAATTSASARAAAAGVGATSAVGTATAVGGSASAASPSGVSATIAVGDVSANGAARCSPTGASAIATVGQASASAVTAVSGSAPAPGVGAVGAVASAGAAMAAGGAGVEPASVGAFASVGAVIAAGSIQIPAAAEPLGVVAHCLTGFATATGAGQFVRAPTGSGYTPRRHEYQSRPAQVSTGGRPSATQENYR